MWKCQNCKESNGYLRSCRKCYPNRNYNEQYKVDAKKMSSHVMEYEELMIRSTDGVKPGQDSDHEYDYIQDIYGGPMSDRRKELARTPPMQKPFRPQLSIPKGSYEGSMSDSREKQARSSPMQTPFRPQLSKPKGSYEGSMSDSREKRARSSSMQTPFRPQLSKPKDTTRIWYDEDAIQRANLYGRRTDNEIRIVMVGKTGTGKSATGNTIMGTTGYFESKLSGKSVTSKCKQGKCSQAGRNILVVDTPGLFDTNISADRISKEIISCVNMSTPGPHAFLLIMQLGRYTEEEIETFNRLFDLFGDGMGNFAILSFTRFDELKKEDRTVENFLEDSADLVKLLKRCNNQYIAFDNTATKEEKTASVKKLLAIVDSIVDKNGGKYYTNNMYRDAEVALQKKIKELEEEKALQKQREINRIETKFANEIERITEKNKKLAEQVSDKEDSQRCVQIEKEKVQQELLKMKDEMAKIDRKHNRDVYQRIQQEKEEKEKQAKALEEKEKQFANMLQSFEKQQMDMNGRFRDMEEKRQLELSEAKEDHDKKMKEAIQRIIDGNIQKYNDMMEKLQLKDKDNAKLQKSFQQQTAAMEARLAETDKRRTEEYEELKRENEKLKEKMKDKGCVIS